MLRERAAPRTRSRHGGNENVVKQGNHHRSSGAGPGTAASGQWAAAGRFSVATDEPSPTRTASARSASNGTKSWSSERWRKRCEEYLEARDARYMSRAGFAPASTRRKTVAANASAPRSSRAGFNFSVRRQPMRREQRRSRNRCRRTPRFLSEHENGAGYRPPSHDGGLP